jgi:Short C-terminal domain
MECVCGCGREIPKKLADRNFIAAAVAIELLAWDRNRALPGAGPEGREGLIARGAECYERLLYSLHGGGGGDPDEQCNAWLQESLQMRAGRSDMTKKRLFSSGSPNVSKEDMARLDRRHPDHSFTGGEPTTAHADTPAAPPSDDDLVDKLERLRVLRDDGVLTEEEFTAAKARLLGRD